MAASRKPAAQAEQAEKVSAGPGEPAGADRLDDKREAADKRARAAESGQATPQTAYLAALKAERRGYEQRDDKAAVAGVDAEIKRVEG